MSQTDRLAFSATWHCLSGCAIGEVAGMILGTALAWSNATTILASLLLAFASGYAFTMVPLTRAGYGVGAAARLALASDTASVTLMEIVDNLLMLIIPGAMDAPLDARLFWGSLALSLLLAGVAAFPLNRWLIARGRGHALIHHRHHYHRHH